MPTDYDKLAQCVYRHHDHAAFERIVEGWQDMVYRRALLVARGDADKATEFAWTTWQRTGTEPDFSWSLRSVGQSRPLITARSWVRTPEGPPLGNIAQLAEHMPYKHDVAGSSPAVPTKFPHRRASK